MLSKRVTIIFNQTSTNVLLAKQIAKIKNVVSIPEVDTSAFVLVVNMERAVNTVSTINTVILRL